MTSSESQPRTFALGFFEAGNIEFYCFRPKGHEGDHRDYTTPDLSPDAEQCRVLFEKPVPHFVKPGRESQIGGLYVTDPAALAALKRIEDVLERIVIALVGHAG